MYPYLFCLSVVFLSQVLECFDDTFFRDLSDGCSNGRNISTYLTTGMGISDAFVVLIAKPEQVNCTLNFLVSEGNYVLVVIEFIDWVFGTYLCGNEFNEVNVMVSNTKGINLCSINAADNSKNNVFRSFGEGVVSVSFKAENDLNCIKIVATSIRDSLGKECSDHETKCAYRDQIFCMAKELLCDGNMNCGIRDEFDEDRNYCEKYLTITPAMVIIGSGIAFISFTLLVALLKNLLPNRKGIFIFKEDETLSEKDRATSQKDFKVKLRILCDPNEVPNMDTITPEEDYRPVFHQRISFRKIRNSSKKY